ncbi:MAG: cytochrome c biogenesis protein CcdA [Proteobacteria bacterium]|nr:MAG: cytochrome c biogenesis protein CcdA [Pseudomonadota bacterium]
MTLVILTYLAGVLTILSPCILPVLPFVFSKSQGSFLKSRLPLLAGMSLTFSLFSAIAIVGGEWIGRANEIGRVVAMVLMAFFGIMLIFPALADKVLAPLTRLGGKIGSNSPPAQKETVGNSFVIGISTGLLWAPCAGPILGLVLTSSAAQGNTATSIGLLLSYSLGAATSLSLALVAGNKFLGTLKKFLGVDKIVKRVLGVFVLLGVVAIAFNLDRTVLTRLSSAGTSSFENKLLSFAGLQTTEKSRRGRIATRPTDSW